MRTNTLFFWPPLLVPALFGWASSGRLPCPVRSSSPLRSLGGRACFRVVAFGVARGCGVFGSPPPPAPLPASGAGGVFLGRPSGWLGWRLSSRSFGCRSSCRPVAARLRSRWVQILSSVHCSSLCLRHQSGARPPTASFRIGHIAAALETSVAAVTAPRPGILDVALSA